MGGNKPTACFGAGPESRAAASPRAPCWRPDRQCTDAASDSVGALGALKTLEIWSFTFLAYGASQLGTCHSAQAKT